MLISPVEAPGLRLKLSFSRGAHRHLHVADAPAHIFVLPLILGSHFESQIYSEASRDVEIKLNV